MESLMSYMAAFGLAAGAGAKAFIPILALGGFSYTPYFELSDRFAWIADPAVMIVLGVLVVLEIIVDAHPDLGRFSDVVSYLPKVVAGFLAFAAVTGRLDSDLAHLSTSGVLGGGTAASVHWLRNQIRRPFRDLAEDAHEAVGKFASLGEAGASATLAGTALVAPPLSMVALGGLVAAGVVTARRVEGPRGTCPHCGGAVRSGALACPHCQAPLDEPPTGAVGES